MTSNPKTSRRIAKTGGGARRSAATGHDARKSVRKIFFDHAFLPEGWARDVTIDIDQGFITSIAVGGNSRGAERIEGIAIPGLPNVHSHAFQRAMAGLTEVRGPDHDNFWTWREAMYRLLAAWTPDDVEAITAFSQMEMLERGFTAVAEFHYLHHDASGRPFSDLAEMSRRIVAAAKSSGIGLTLLPCYYGFGGFGGLPPDPGQRRFLNDPERFLALFSGAKDAIATLPDAAIGVAPHSLRAVTPATLQEVVAACADGPVHIHAAEQVREVEECLSWSGRRPVEWLLDELNIDPRWCIIHATHMTPRETERLAQSGAAVGLCPITEANLGDGVFDAPRFLASGGRFAVGTDSNVQITAPGELRQLEYSQRLFSRSRNVLAPGRGASTGRFIYERAVSGGAQASARRIGALHPGLRADIVVLDMNHPDLVAGRGDTWLDAYVFTAGRHAIRSVVCGGEKLVEEGIHHRRSEITERYRRSMARLAAA